MDYIIVVADNVIELERKVRRNLISGYKPTGGITIRRTYPVKNPYMQAMWKE